MRRKFPRRSSSSRVVFEYAARSGYARYASFLRSLERNTRAGLEMSEMFVFCSYVFLCGPRRNHTDTSGVLSRKFLTCTFSRFFRLVFFQRAFFCYFSFYRRPFHDEFQIPKFLAARACTHIVPTHLYGHVFFYLVRFLESRGF